MSDKVLVVDDKQMMRDSVGATLQRAGWAVVAAADGESALKQLGRHRPAAVVTDLKMPEMDGLELLGRLRAADPQLPVVLMTAYGTVGDAVAAMKRGAFDFIQKPFEGDQLVMVVGRAIEHRKLVTENDVLRSSVRDAEHHTPALVGKAGPMRRLAQQIHQVARSHGTVLICGESGTGKEVVARTLHHHSPRRDMPMLCLNCAALSSSLLESELFGHEKGAFTGADQLRKGRFELADGGTLLLDEISEISPQLQAKLLRVLQEGQFERVGSSTTISVDVRVVATTNRDLGRSVAAGEFRQDLYYRLNVLPLHLPPLRDRLEDVALLAEHFLGRVARREGRDAKRFDDGALALMRRYPWPGNVRELQNICERASVLCRERVIPAELIEPWLAAPAGSMGEAAGSRPAAFTAFASAGALAGAGPAGSPPPQASGRGAFSGWTPEPAAGGPEPSASGASAPAGVKPLADLEREQIVRALGHFGGNRARTAEALGIGVRTLGLKLKKWKEQNLVAQSI